jgi:NAD-dependent deacetylase
MNFSSDDLRAIDRVVDLLAASRSLLFITGAGISADSGLPTYRGIGGLYDSGQTEEGMPIEELLSAQVMLRRPDLTWKYLAEIARAAQGATFNRGHAVIAEMERHFERVWVLTQNIDGFHRQAGSRNLIEIHGDIHDLYCTRCRFRKTIESIDEVQIPPRCPDCGEIVRPDVVLFGELLPEEKVERLYAELERGFDLTLAIGTTAVFPYIAGPVNMARQLGRPTVEINPGTSRVSHLVDVKLDLGAAAALDAVWSRYPHGPAQGL